MSTGCGRKGAPTTFGETAVTRTASAGGVTLTYTISNTDTHFEEPVRVLLEASGPAGAQLQLASFTDLIDERGLGFEVRATQKEATTEKADDGMATHIRRLFELRFVLPGEYELPGARVDYAAASDETKEVSESDADNMGETPQEGQSRELATRTLLTQPIKVLARDPGNKQLSKEELAQIRVLDPIELPPTVSPWWWVAGAVALLLLTAWLLRKRIAAALQARREARAAKAVIVPAHEWALKRLAELMAEGLIQRHRFQDFYYEVSFIVRGYIERRYGVTAGEMTTEEFLDAVVQDRRFGGETTTHLKRFLESCDLVKYARHEPTADDANEMHATAEAFVQQTRLDRQAIDKEQSASMKEQAA